METKEQRQKRIKKMLDAGIANYEAYIKQLEDVIDSKTYAEAVEYYENLSDSNKLYATILQTYKMMLSIYQSGLESENENDKKLKSAIDEIMRKMTAEEATSKGKRLADDVEKQNCRAYRQLCKIYRPCKSREQEKTQHMLQRV